jgi:hypothetical protein
MLVKKIKLILIILALVMIGGVCFIKFNTSAAAEFTDNVLRPTFGANNVVYIEKVFYNLSDKTQELTFNKNKKMDGDSLGSLITGQSNLDLTSIKVSNGLIPIDGEGVWKNRPLKLFPNQTVIATTFVRPDVERPYAMVTVAQMDTNLLKLGLTAGTKEPGGAVGKPGTGVIPSNIIESGNLVAAFDGGFQYRDGQYGMVVGDTTYLPLKNDLGTLIGYKNGILKIIKYEGQPLGNDVAFVRQNCPILIENGQLSVTNPKDKELWGRTITSGIYTWRSGLGINKEGKLLYAVGNNLTPETLSIALKQAGAVDAIQLDINPYWVKFNIFNTNGGKNYSSEALSKRLYDGKQQYLDGYKKDFFYLYKS